MKIPVPLTTPMNWSARRAKYLLDRVRREPRDSDGIITAFRDGRVTLRSNRREDGFTNAELEIGYQGIRVGDLVIHGMDGFAGAIGVSESDGKASPVVHAYLPTHDCEPRYYAYLLRHLAQTGFIESLAKGIRQRSTAFDSETLLSLFLPLPALQTQLAIADYLDTETARIDTLIEKKQRMVDLLGKVRQAIVSDKLANLGESEAVRSVPLGYCSSQVDKPNIGLREQNLLSLSHGNVVRKDIEGRVGLLPESFETYNVVKPGDTVLRLTDLQNDQRSLRVGFVSETGIITSAYVTLRPHAEVDSKFFAYSLKSMDIRKDFYALGAGVRQSLKFDELRRVLIHIPSLDTQREITRYLDAVIVSIETTTQAVLRQIALLREHRKALIAAAVTGQLDLSGAAA